jgi:hypothetical protein
MARWTDLAKWRGPSPNITEDGQAKHLGLVVHIAEGWFDGTIAWQRNKQSGTSSHFIVGRDGAVAQMVDTEDRAWTQKAGNSSWMSVECEGFTKGHRLNPGGWESLTDAQMTAIARILVRCNAVYGVPLQVTSSASTRGLGHHSMGGTSWGHQDCPGDPIIRQKSEIVRRAVALRNGNPINEEDDMQQTEKLVLSKWTKDTYDIGDTTVGAGLRDIYAYTRNASDKAKAIADELAAARLRDEAILGAVKGLNTTKVLELINAKAAEETARDAAAADQRTEILALVQAAASGKLNAEDVVAQIGELLTKGGVEPPADGLAAAPTGAGE